eukprot:TRINITY_DN5467_c0_g1_i2.p5 TRINITY_DN5467_c0_g1~~TRINITY_DN5467_c0_g1_i2.p5  ORF type:complete len:138 (-),score=12.79 TRINITY_DN5467_c0_g1_i2:1229-1594(-)
MPLATGGHLGAHAPPGLATVARGGGAAAAALGGGGRRCGGGGRRWCGPARNPQMAAPAPRRRGATWLRSWPVAGGQPAAAVHLEPRVESGRRREWRGGGRAAGVRLTYAATAAAWQAHGPW